MSGHILYLRVVLVAAAAAAAGSARSFGRREADLLETANGDQELIVLLVLLKMDTPWMFK